MFMVTYGESNNSSGNGQWTNKTKNFNIEDTARKFIRDNNGRDDFKHLLLWAPVGHQNENIDYKEKFEELYDFVLKGAGVRQVEIPKKKMI